MGHEQRGHPGGEQDRADLLAHLRAQARVEAAEGLVEQHELGRGGQGARERDALLLAAGQLAGHPRPEALQADELEQLGHPRAVPAAAQPVGDVARNVEVGEQRVVLEDHPHPPALRRQECPVGGQQPPAHVDRAGVGALEARDQAQHRRLAAAAGPEQRAHLAPGHREIDGVDGADGAVGLGELMAVDRAHRSRAASTARGTAEMARSTSEGIAPAS